MFTATLEIIMKAIEALITRSNDIDVSTKTLIIMGVSVGVKILLYLYCRIIPGAAVATLALDHRNDVMMNTIGISCALVGYYFFWWVDPVGGILIGSYIMISWAKNGWVQVRLLSGRSASPAFINKLIYLSWNHHPDIVAIDTVRAFHLAERYMVEVDLVLSPDMPLRQAHDIGETLQKKLESLEDVERAFVHLDYEFEHKPEHNLSNSKS